MGGVSKLVGGPGATKVETESSNATQGIGKGIEDILEFVGGDEALKGLSWAQKFKALAPVAELLEKYPALAKAAHVGSTALRSGTVAAGQAVAKGSEHPVAAGVAGAAASGVLET